MNVADPTPLPLDAASSEALDAWHSLISDISIHGLSEDYTEPHTLVSHAHSEGQLVYAATGVIVIGSEHGYWVVPPTRAVWLAPGVQHWARTSANVQLRSVLLNAPEQSQIPTKSCVLRVSPLMREVVTALSAREKNAALSPMDAALTTVLMLQLKALPILPLHLPALRDPRLARIEKHVLSKPEERVSLEDWARALNLDQRTLHRLFVKEVGMSFRQWLQQAQLLLALEWLADGRKVIDVADRLGYSSHSAFTSMFRRNLGLPPSAFYVD